jgi:hypothetical protein
MPMPSEALISSKPCSLKIESLKPILPLTNIRIIPLTVKINLSFWMLYGFGHQSLTNKFLHLIL